MTIKGRIVDFLSGIAVVGPWRSACENMLVSVAHKHPKSRTVTSFCRHFGGKLGKYEKGQVERIAVFETGGNMFCGGTEGVAEVSLFYYFFGTNAEVHTEDENAMVKLLRRTVREGDIFFDLGANLGFYSCYVVPLCGQSGAVHAFEPNPSLVPLLRRSVQLNQQWGKIYLNEVAVGKESGTMLPLYGVDKIGGSSLYPHEWLNRGSEVVVPLLTIDEYVRQKRIERIDVMKIDIEGAELDAVKGMEETFRTCPPGLILCELTLLPGKADPLRQSPEVLRRSSGAADAGQLVEVFKRKGYALWGLAADGRLCAWNPPVVTSDSPIKLINAAFVHPELLRQRQDVFVEVPAMSGGLAGEVEPGSRTNGQDTNTPQE